MVAIVGGFIVVRMVRGNRSTTRKSTTIEIANHLQKARFDSIRRQPKTVDQMAQVQIFNRRSYSVAVDADGDSQLDIPLVMTLPAEKGVEINGPFPRTLIFDASGLTVDMQNRRVPPPKINISNGAGASMIKFSSTGNVEVVSALK